MRTLRAAMVLGIAALASLAQEDARPPVMVYLGDGSAFPLRSWSLSYELASWRQGTTPAFATFNRVESSDIILGKKTRSTAGAVVEIQYVEEEREQDVDGETKKVKVLVAKGLTFTAPNQKKVVLKPEPPQRELLLPSGESGLLYQPRSIDLKGETMTGTRRELCLLSFSVLVECNAAAGQQIVKLEFPK